MGMFLDILGEDDPLYQVIKRKEEQKSLKDIMQETAIMAAMAGFDELGTLAKAKISNIDDVERLQQLIVDLHLHYRRTREQMEHIFLSLGE